MQWSDVTKAPPPKMLRQFAGLWLVVFLGMAAWRWGHGNVGLATQGLAAVAVVVGAAGLLSPTLMKPIWIAWMVAAFPIGWTISRVVLGAIFFLVVTPLAVVFRLMGRDALRLRRTEVSSHWVSKRRAGDLREYFRQS